MKDRLRKLNFIGKARSRRIFKANLKTGVVAVEIKNTIGIGARLAWVLEILAYCDEKHLRPQFRFTYPDADTDYFAQFFSIQANYVCADTSVKFVKIFTISELDLGKNYDTELTVEFASYLIRKYLVIREDILQEVEAFWQKNFLENKQSSEANIMGVHFRGTDKSTEAPVVTYECVEENIKIFLHKYPQTSGVFVSSDDHNFITYIKDRTIGVPIVSRNDSYRATNNEAIHLANQNKYDINRDAIVNCLLLARCYALIKSASILSAWSVLFNPEILLVMLNAPFEQYFPERALLERVVYDPV
jgi:hypothetical protein